MYTLVIGPITNFEPDLHLPLPDPNWITRIAYHVRRLPNTARIILNSLDLDIYRFISILLTQGSAKNVLLMSNQDHFALQYLQGRYRSKEGTFIPELPKTYLAQGCGIFPLVSMNVLAVTMKAPNYANFYTAFLAVFNATDKNITDLIREATNIKNSIIGKGMMTFSSNIQEIDLFDFS